MSGRSNETVALFLMRMARALLDRAGPKASIAAIHLHHAIELAEAAFDQPAQISPENPSDLAP